MSGTGTNTSLDCSISAGSGGNIIPAWQNNFVLLHGNPNISWRPGFDNMDYYCTPDGTANLVHEICHTLGLGHSNQITYTYPSVGCCTRIAVSDIALEPPGNPSSQSSCSLSFGSNNVMSRDAGCYNYLSPMQMAAMHYYLRTSRASCLNQTSYALATVRDAAYDYTLPSTQTWSTNAKYFKGNITIPTGKSLTIKCTVAMTHGAKITVEKGAQLIIDRGKITNISGRSWAGIEVEGDRTKNQAIDYTNNPGAGVFQGALRVINNGIIENAEVAVKNYGYDANGQVKWGSVGGIIIADNSTFKNNFKDVEFLSYPINFGSNSQFTQCNFLTTAKLNDNLVPYTHVSLYDIKGVKFNGCSFEYSAGNTYTTHGSGITSIDAIYTVNKTTTHQSLFKNLDYGVYITNFNPLRPPTIVNTKFDSNEKIGLFVNNAYNMVIQKNEFKLPGTHYAVGSYLKSSKYYMVKNNTFYEALNNKTSPGIVLYQSGIGVHEVYSNTFYNLSAGVAVMGDNAPGQNVNPDDGLRINCNDFASNMPNNYDVALVNANVSLGTSGNLVVAPRAMQNQGVITSNSDPKKFVRNKYAAPSLGAVTENKWYIAGTSVKTYTHASNSQTYTIPLPKPQNSDIAVITLTSNALLNYTLDCKANTSSTGGEGATALERLGNMNTYLAELKTETEEDFSEIQSTVNSKLNLLLTDSVSAYNDSVISLLSNNPSNMDNADVLNVFACINKEDYTAAASKMINLPISKYGLVPLLNKYLISYQQEGKLKSLTAADIPFFETFANNDTLEGNASAKTALKLFNYRDIYVEPFSIENENNQGRSALLAESISPESLKTVALIEKSLKIYPNPSNESLFINYHIANGPDLELEIKDALGKIVYKNKIIANTNLSIALDGIKNGVYILSAYDKNNLVYKTKIVVIK